MTEPEVQPIYKGGPVTAEQQRNTQHKNMPKSPIYNPAKNVYSGFIFCVHKLVKYPQPISLHENWRKIIEAQHDN